MDINIYFDGQLIYTSLKLTYKGKSKVIDNLVVDTGAAKSFISINAVDDINIAFEDGDYITTVYGVGGSDNSFEKLLDCIEFGSKKYEHYKVDFGAFYDDYNINGLIGLDLLKDAGVTIDLKNMRIIEAE